MAEAADKSTEIEDAAVSADKSPSEKKSDEKTKVLESCGEELECAVCLQKCIHPVRLPCKHIFCFLCVKGVANLSKRCAMCRQEIPANFLDHPDLLDNLDLDVADETVSGFQWFYEGRNGWWRYDPRSNEEIEEAYQNKSNTVTLMIAGSNYDIDFHDMKQKRVDNPTSTRNIKRDLVTSTSKGIAGLSAFSLIKPQPPVKRRGRGRGRGRKKRRSSS